LTVLCLFFYTICHWNKPACQAARSRRPRHLLLTPCWQPCWQRAHHGTPVMNIPCVLVACIMSACVVFSTRCGGEKIVRNKICVFFCYEDVFWPYLTNRSQINLGTRVMPSRCFYSLQQLSGSVRFDLFPLLSFLRSPPRGGGGTGVSNRIQLGCLETKARHLR